MTQQEFEQHRQTWIKEWADKWRLFDIDFEMYMIMKGMAPEEYRIMNEASWGKNEMNDDEWSESFI
jgi:hypothetical protein